MNKSMISVLGILIQFPIFATSYWIVGDEYIGFSKEGTHLELQSNLKPQSWALDRKSCQLWISDDKSNQLLAFNHVNNPHAIGDSERILSEVESGVFFTLSNDQKLSARDAQGAILSTETPSWPSQALELFHSKNDINWTLNRNHSTKSLWIEGRDSTGNEIKKFTVNGSAELWGNARLRVDRKKKSLWVGFSSTSKQHIYQTYVHRYNYDGKLEQVATWDNKGLFFDSCLDKEGNLIISRDVPSLQFTVPVTSYLELVPPTGKSRTLLALETNDFADSLACEDGEITYVARSIFTSSHPKLMRFNPQSGKAPEKLLELPSKASQLYACVVR